jgi:hypothetical protein
MFARVKQKISNTSKPSSKSSSKAASPEPTPAAAVTPAAAPATVPATTPATVPAPTTMSAPGTHVKTVKVAGDVEVFYREAGTAKANNTILLLHGFPSVRDLSPSSRDMVRR